MGFFSDAWDSKTQQRYSYDKKYAKKMAKLARRQFEMSKESWDLFKEIAVPYEREMFAANRELLPLMTDFQRETTKEALADLEANRPVKEAMRTSQLAFYDEAAKPIDTVGRMREAAGDVSQSYDTAEGEMTRTMGRMGLSGDTESIADAIARMKTSKAKSMAGAKNFARRQAENERFGKLGTAVSMSGGGVRGAVQQNPMGVMGTGNTGQAQGYGAMAGNMFAQGVNTIRSGNRVSGIENTEDLSTARKSKGVMSLGFFN